MPERTFFEDFRKFFSRGLAILLPSVLTLWILWQLVGFVYKNVGEPINRGIRLVVIEALPLFVQDEAGRMPAWWSPSDRQVRHYLDARRAEGRRVPPNPRDLSPADPDYERAVAEYPAAAARTRTLLRRQGFRDWWNNHWYLEATGLLVAMVLIYLVGLLVGNFLGRRIYSRFERYMARIPGFKQIYPHVKQAVDLVMGERAIAFKRAVLVEYPRKGIWSVGLLTGNSLQRVRDEARTECFSVFIPSTPMPLTGFTINVRREDAIELPITIDQAIRFIITGGVLSAEDAPPGEGPGKLNGSPTTRGRPSLAPGASTDGAASGGKGEDGYS